MREEGGLSIGTGSPGSSSVVEGRYSLARVALWQWYVAVVVFLAAVFLFFLVYLQGHWKDVLPQVSWLGLAAVLFFVCVAAFADRFRVKVGESTEISAGFLADFLSAALLGPLPGAVVGICGVLGTHKRGQGGRTLFSASAFALIGGCCGLVFWMFQAQSDDSGLTLVVGGVIAATVYQALNYGLFIPIMWLRRQVGPREWFDMAFKPYLPFHVFFLLLSLGLIYSFQSQGVGVFVLSFLPVLGLVYAFRSYARQKEMAQSLERFSLQMAASMITALDLKDNYTAQHSAAVAQWSFDLARRLGLSARERSLARLSGLLHDLGKISVPDEILNCRRRLAEEEWEIVQQHTTAGQTILGNMTDFEELGNIVLHHHEHYDGKGYPLGLSGDEIPLISRVVAVCDCYSAMVSNRPYSSKRSPGEAIQELRHERGRQFDPVAVDAFVAMLEGGTDQYQLAEDVDFHLQFQKVRFLGDFA